MIPERVRAEFMSRHEAHKSAPTDGKMQAAWMLGETIRAIKDVEEPVDYKALFAEFKISDRQTRRLVTFQQAYALDEVWRFSSLRAAVQAAAIQGRPQSDTDIGEGAMTEVTVTNTDWQAMPFNARKKEIGERWVGFQRRSLVEGHDIGRGLRAIRDEMQHGEWAPYLAEIGMERTMAHRLMTLADSYQMLQLATFGSVDDALKALAPKRPRDEPETRRDLQRAADTEADMQEALHQAEMDEAAAEVQAETADADREAREERLAVRLADTDGDAVEVLAEKLDRADVRHGEDVGAVNDARDETALLRRKAQDICDALLAATPSTALDVIDEVLAKFFAVARK